ncbi:hypothetical protein FEP73_04270 [Burkholderia multivorans]|nr:hypothetical protein [Burkholderia multivorans]
MDARYAVVGFDRACVGKRRRCAFDARAGPVRDADRRRVVDRAERARDDAGRTGARQQHRVAVVERAELLRDEARHAGRRRRHGRIVGQPRRDRGACRRAGQVVRLTVDDAGRRAVRIQVDRRAGVDGAGRAAFDGDRDTVRAVHVVDRIAGRQRGARIGRDDTARACAVDVRRQRAGRRPARVRGTARDAEQHRIVGADAQVLRADVDLRAGAVRVEADLVRA